MYNIYSFVRENSFLLTTYYALRINLQQGFHPLPYFEQNNYPDPFNTTENNYWHQII